MFSLVAYDNTNIFSEDTLIDHTGSVNLQSIGDGDYIKFIVDNATGKILGWKHQDLEKLINGQD